LVLNPWVKEKRAPFEKKKTKEESYSAMKIRCGLEEGEVPNQTSEPHFYEGLERWEKGGGETSGYPRGKGKGILPRMQLRMSGGIEPREEGDKT